MLDMGVNGSIISTNLFKTLEGKDQNDLKKATTAKTFDGYMKLLGGVCVETTVCCRGQFSP